MKKPIEEVVGDNVLRLRKQLGWSQKKLSDKTGVSQRVISNVEQGGGAGSSSVRILEAISEGLGVPTFLMMTPGLPTDKCEITRMAKVMESFVNLSDHAQQRILELVEDYKNMHT